MKRLWIAAAMAAVLAGTAQAQGQLAYTSRVANVRAGPARDYPIVAILPAGFAVSIQGCLPQYTWCDVIAGASRGWVYAGNLQYYYQNGYVPFLQYAPLLGIAIFGFVLDDYWGQHYRDRRWYPERDRWSGVPQPWAVPPRHRPAPGFVPAPGYVPPPPREVHPPRDVRPPREVMPRAVPSPGIARPGPSPSQQGIPPGLQRQPPGHDPQRGGSRRERPGAAGRDGAGPERDRGGPTERPQR